MPLNITPTDPHDLIQKISAEARCIMEMREESEAAKDFPDEPETQEQIIALYLRGITLIGRAWGLQPEADAALESLKNPNADEPLEDVWTPLNEQILTALWGLFDTAVRLESRDDREQIRQLAQEVTDFHALDLRVQDL